MGHKQLKFRNQGDCIFYNISQLIGLLALPGGIMMIIFSMGEKPVGPPMICMRDQIYFNFTADSSYTNVKVAFSGGLSPRGVTTYIFNKKPKTFEFTNQLPEFKFGKETSRSITVPNQPISLVSFHLETDVGVDVAYVVTEESDTEKIYSKENVQFLDGRFLIEEQYSSPHFVISKVKESFSGSFYVNVTSERIETSSSSLKYVDKCNYYPCEWKLDDERFKGKKLWVVTENTGDDMFTLDDKLEYSFVFPFSRFMCIWFCFHSLSFVCRYLGLMVGGIVVLVVGEALFIFAFFFTQSRVD